MKKLVSPLSIPSVDELSELTNEDVYTILQRDRAARRGLQATTMHISTRPAEHNAGSASAADHLSLRPPPPLTSLSSSSAAQADRTREERPASRFAQTTYTSTNKVEPVNLSCPANTSNAAAAATSSPVPRSHTTSSSTSAAMTTALSRLMTPRSDAQLLEIERWRWRTLVQSGWFHQHIHHARWDEAWLRRGRRHGRGRLALQAATAVTMSHTRALCIALNIHPSLLETMESPCEAPTEAAGRRGGGGNGGGGGAHVMHGGHRVRRPHGRPRRGRASLSESENEGNDDDAMMEGEEDEDDDEEEDVYAEDMRANYAYRNRNAAAVAAAARRHYRDDDDDEEEEEEEEEEAGYDDYRSFFANEHRRGLCDEIEDPAPYLFAWQLPAFIAGDVATTLGQIGSQVRAQYHTFATRPLPTVQLSVTRAAEVYQTLSDARAAAGEGARVMFHYSAHGMPALQDGQLYFLHAVNSNRGSLATGMPYGGTAGGDAHSAVAAAASAMYVRAAVSTLLARVGLPLVFVADCVDAGAVLRELLRCYHDRLVTSAAMAAAAAAAKASGNNNTSTTNNTTTSGGVRMGAAMRHGSRPVSSAELDVLTNNNNNNTINSSSNSNKAGGSHNGNGNAGGNGAALSSSLTAPPRGALLFIGSADKANEGIHQLASPYRARLPADLLTSCLTTPIRMVLLYFMIHHGRHNADLHPLLLHLLPGALQDRKTPLGQLHFFMQRLTENIAWSSLPIELYSLLFREDVHVAPLFRNYLIAEFLIVGKLGGKLVVYPPLPPMHHHPLWLNLPCVLEVTLVTLLQAVRPRPAAVLSAMEYREWLDERITRWKYEQQQQQQQQQQSWPRQDASRAIVSATRGERTSRTANAASPPLPSSSWTFMSAQAIAGSPALIIAAPTTPLPRITEDHPMRLISFLTEDLRSVEAAIDTLTTQAFCVPPQPTPAGRRSHTARLPSRNVSGGGDASAGVTSSAHTYHTEYDDEYDDEDEDDEREEYDNDDGESAMYRDYAGYRAFSAYRNTSLQQQQTQSQQPQSGNAAHAMLDPSSRVQQNEAYYCKSATALPPAPRRATSSANNNNNKEEEDDDERSAAGRPVFPLLTLMPTLLQSLLVVSHREKGTELLCRFMDVGMPAVVQCAKANLYRIVLDHYWTRPDLRFLLPSTLFLFCKACYVDAGLIDGARQRSVVIRVCKEVLQSPIRFASTSSHSSPSSSAMQQQQSQQQQSQHTTSQGSGGEQTNLTETTSSRTRVTGSSAASHTTGHSGGNVVQGAWQSVVLGDYASVAGQRLLACSLLSLLVMHDPAACTQCHELGVLQLCCQLLAATSSHCGSHTSSSSAATAFTSAGVPGASWRPQDSNKNNNNSSTNNTAAKETMVQAELDEPPRAIATHYHMALLALFVALLHRWQPETPPQQQQQQQQPPHDDHNTPYEGVNNNNNNNNEDEDETDDEGGEGEGEDESEAAYALQPLDGQVHALPATSERTLQASLQLVGPALERLLYDRASALRGAAMRALAVTLIMPCATEPMRVPFASIVLRRLYEEGRPPSCEANALVLVESTGLGQTLVRWLIARLSQELGSVESLTGFVTSYLARWLRQTRLLRPMTHPYLAVVREAGAREAHITLAEQGSNGQASRVLTAATLQQALQDIFGPGIRPRTVAANNTINNSVSDTRAARTTTTTTVSNTAPLLMHTSHSVPHWVSRSATTATAAANNNNNRNGNVAEVRGAASQVRLAPLARHPTQVMAYLTVLSNLVRLFVEHSFDCGPYVSARLRSVLNDDLGFLFAPWFAQQQQQRQQEERAGRPSARHTRRGFTSQTAGHVAFQDLLHNNTSNSDSALHGAPVRAEAASLRPPSAHFSSSSSSFSSAAAAVMMAATDEELHRYHAVDGMAVWRELFTQVRQRVGGNYHDLHGRGALRQGGGGLLLVAPQQPLAHSRARRPYHRTTAFNWEAMESHTAGAAHSTHEPHTANNNNTSSNNNNNGGGGTGNAFLHPRHHTRQEGAACRSATPRRLPIAPLPTPLSFARFCPRKTRHVRSFVFSALGYLADMLLVPEDDRDGRHPYNVRTAAALHDYLSVLSNGLHSSTALDGLAQSPGAVRTTKTSREGGGGGGGDDASRAYRASCEDEEDEAANEAATSSSSSSSTTHMKTRGTAAVSRNTSTTNTSNSSSSNTTTCPYVLLCTSKQGGQALPGDVTHFLFHPSQPHAVACTDRGYMQVYEYGVSAHSQRAFLRPCSAYHIADVVARAGPLSYTSLQLRYGYRTGCYAREFAVSEDRHDEDEDETSSSSSTSSSRLSVRQRRGGEEEDERQRNNDDEDEDNDEVQSRQTAAYRSRHGSQRTPMPSRTASEERGEHKDNKNNRQLDNDSTSSDDDDGDAGEGREARRRTRQSVHHQYAHHHHQQQQQPALRLSSSHRAGPRLTERRASSVPDSRPAFHNSVTGMHLIDAAYETILCTIRRTGAVELFTNYTHSSTVRRLSTFETAPLGLCGHQTQDRLSSYQPQSSLLYLSSGDASVAAWDLQTEQLDTLYSVAVAAAMVEAPSVLQAHPGEPRQCALAAGAVYVFDLRSAQPRLFLSPLAHGTSSSSAASACFSAGAQPRSNATASSSRGAASAFASPVCVHVNFSLRYPHALFTGYSGGMVLVWDDRTTRTPLYTYNSTSHTMGGGSGCHGNSSSSSRGVPDTSSEADEDDGGLHGTRFMEVHACSKNLLTLAVRANTLFITEPWQAGHVGPIKHCQYTLPGAGEASVAVFHPYRPLLAVGGWGGPRMALYGRQQVC